jgi:glycine cleavage system aminomethyltransferase T
MALEFEHVTAAPVSPAATEHMVRMRDGARLATDVYLPAGLEGGSRTLACLALDAAGLHPHGGEAIAHGGAIVGYVAAGGYGHCVERAIALAYLPGELVDAGATFEVDVLGEPILARTVPGALFDPGGERMLRAEPYR